MVYGVGNFGEVLNLVTIFGYHGFVYLFILLVNLHYFLKNDRNNLSFDFCRLFIELFGFFIILFWLRISETKLCFIRKNGNSLVNSDFVQFSFFLYSRETKLFIELDYVLDLNVSDSENSI